MMAQAKIIYILMIEVKEFIFFFALLYFLKEIENMFSVFLLSYRNIRESLGELEKAVSTAFLILPNCQECFYSSIEHGTHFLFLKYNLLLRYRLENAKTVK